MPKYIVNVREVHTQMVEIEAKDENDAKQNVREGKGTYLDDTLEYSHTLDPDGWTVELSKDEPTVTCKLCGKEVPEKTAHRHGGGWVGDDCCWDERLRAGDE